MSSITRTHFPLCVLCLHIRSEGLQSCLVCSVHAGGGEVLNLAVHEQPERSTTIRLAKIEFQRMRFGKAFELQHLEVSDEAMRQQIRQNVMSMLVPGARGRVCIPAVDHFERRIRRVAGEILVGTTHQPSAGWSTANSFT